MTATLHATDRLGDILLNEGLISADQLKAALAEQKQGGHRLGYLFVKLGMLEEVEITKALARQLRMPASSCSGSSRRTWRRSTWCFRSAATAAT